VQGDKYECNFNIDIVSAVGICHCLSVRKDAIRNIIVRIFAFITGILTLFVVCRYFKDGISLSIENRNIIDMTISLAEVLIAAYIIFTGIKNKKFIVSIFAAVQTALILWFEFTQKHGINVHSDIVFEGFPLLWSSLWDVSEALY